MIIKDTTYKIISNAEKKEFDTNNIVDYLPDHNNITLVCYDEDINEIVKSIYNQYDRNVVHIFPSIACMFCFNTPHLFYIGVIKSDDDLFKVKVEIVVDKGYVKELRSFFEGNVDYVINEICLLMMRTKKDVLCENIYVHSECNGDKRLVEERLMMEIGKGIDVKYAKFLKVPGYLNTSEYCHEGIVDDPISIGGLIASNVFFEKRLWFMTKKDFNNGDYSKLSPYND